MFIRPSLRPWRRRIQNRNWTCWSWITTECPLGERFGKLDEIDGGWGEALWIKEGTIVLTSGSGLHPETYEPNTRRLLEMCGAQSS